MAPKIPQKKFRNARRAYAKDAARDKPLVLIDTTVFGGARNGALLTARKFYAREMGQKAQSVTLDGIESAYFVEGIANNALCVNQKKWLETNVPDKEALRHFAEMLSRIPHASVSAPAGGPTGEALGQLKQLRDDGVITEQDFQAKKQEYLKHVQVWPGEASPEGEPPASEDGHVAADWGSLVWLAGRGIGNAEGLTLGRVIIRTGKANPHHAHRNCEEALYLLRGRLEHVIGDKRLVQEAGETVTIPAGVFHHAVNIGYEDADMIVAYDAGERDFVKPSDVDPAPPPGRHE